MVHTVSQGEFKSGERSSRNPVSLAALSIQVMVTELLPPGTALVPLGARGASGWDTDARFEKSPNPPSFFAWTRYQYALGLSPPLRYDTAPGARSATTLYGPPSAVARCTW